MSILLTASELPVNVIGWQVAISSTVILFMGMGGRLFKPVPSGLFVPKLSHFEIDITINYSCFTASVLYVVVIVPRDVGFLRTALVLN